MRKIEKAPAALEAVNRLIDWYQRFKPEVRQVRLFDSEYAAFEKAAGTYGIAITPTGLVYRGFQIVALAEHTDRAARQTDVVEAAERGETP